MDITSKRIKKCNVLEHISSPQLPYLSFSAPSKNWKLANCHLHNFIPRHEKL